MGACLEKAIEFPFQQHVNYQPAPTSATGAVKKREGNAVCFPAALTQCLDSLVEVLQRYFSPSLTKLLLDEAQRAALETSPMQPVSLPIIVGYLEEKLRRYVGGRPVAEKCMHDLRKRLSNSFLENAQSTPVAAKASEPAKQFPQFLTVLSVNEPADESDVLQTVRDVTHQWEVPAAQQQHLLMKVAHTIHALRGHAPSTVVLIRAYGDPDARVEITITGRVTDSQASKICAELGTQIQLCCDDCLNAEVRCVNGTDVQTRLVTLARATAALVSA